MAFNAEEFLEDVTWEAFDELKKTDLMTLAKELKLDQTCYAQTRN